MGQAWNRVVRVSGSLTMKRDEIETWLLARSIAFINLAFEKSPGGETAPIPFCPNAEIPIAHKIAELDGFIRTEMKRDDIPGLSVALIRKSVVD